MNRLLEEIKTHIETKKFRILIATTSQIKIDAVKEVFHSLGLEIDITGATYDIGGY